ncbi:MAG: carbohydrate binding family 9 domain-containing protein [Gemmatimonadetes bacterium]|nr:carbohydrate binding family 9 domain-containing protein [Gemmatimonadota bacterium]
MSTVRRLVTLALAAVTLTTGLDAQVRTYHGRNRQTVAELPRLDEAPTIDGMLDDAVWSRAVLLTGFSAYLPLDDRPAADSTDVLVYYSSTHVYFAVRAFESHGAVHATLAARDKIDSDDYIQILLDPFNDRRRAFVFGINPLGAQADGVRTEGFSPPQPRGQTFGGNPPAFIDLSPDLVFESKGRLTDTGYEIEVAIPLKSIRFQGSNTQQWAVQVLRFVQHSGYQQTWTPARRGAASFLVQSGTLTGLHDLRREAVVELNPELTESYNGAYPAGSTDFGYTSTPNVGGNVRWRIVPNLTLNATVRPDFSQVEADAAQVPGDTRFALFFPERRPFFIDGIEQFDAPNNLIYTRRILQPDFASKLTGRFGRTSIGWMGALDDPVASASGKDRPLFNIVRLRRDILQASTAGFTFTDRTERDGFSRVAMADTRILFKGAYAFNATVGGSATRPTTGGETATAPFWEVGVNRTGLRYGLRYVFSGIDSSFDAASGFVPRRDLVSGAAYNRFSWYGKPGDFIESYLIRQGFDFLWLFDRFWDGKAVQETKIQAENVFNIRGGWVLSVTPVRESFLFDSRTYARYRVLRARTGSSLEDTLSFQQSPRTPTAVVLLRLNTPQFERWTGRFTGFLGKDIEFFETSTARRIDLTGEVDFRPTDQMRVNASYLYSHFTRSRDGTTLSRATVPRMRLEYQVSRALFLRFVGQYDNRVRDALRDPVNDLPIAIWNGSTYARAGKTATRDFRVDWLINFVPSPGTVFFAGYGSSLTEDDAFRFREMRRVRDGVFVKMSYLFRR